MAHPILSKHVEVIDTLQSTQRLIQVLILPVLDMQAKSSDQGIQSLYDQLCGSLSLLYARAKELCENVHDKATVQERSVCAPQGLQKCQEVCDETQEFSKMIEEARAAQVNGDRHFLLPPELVNNDQTLRYFINGINRLMGQMEVLNRGFVAARNIKEFNESTHPSSSENNAAAQACVHAQVALLDLVRKIEEVDSRIGKMPPAYETYLDTPSYIPGETEEGCNHLMFKSAARTIQKYLEHWTERAGYGEARNRFDVYGALSKSINSPKTHDRDFDKTHKDPRPREEPSAGSTSHQAHTRKSFLSRSGSGPKPCLHRKKSVTWDPTLDKKHGAQEPKMLSSHEWCESFIEDQSSYWNGIPEAGERDPNNVKALNAIEFVLSNVRQWCLDLMDPRCDLDSGYSHVKKYSRLVEMLMSDVLEKLDSLCIDSNDLGNRQTRKRFANETNELLRQMDLFMQEFRGHAPNQSRKKDSRDPDTTPNSPDLPGDEHGFVYSRAHISPNAICLGKIQVWLTKEELATGGRRTVHFEAEIQNPITGAPQHAMLKMPIYIKPGSKPGTKIDAGHAWCQDSRSRTPGGY